MSNRASSAVRLLAWAIAIGLFAAVLQSLIAVAVSGAIGRFAALAADDLAQSVLAQALLSTLLALTTLALAFLAGVSAELPLASGALGGAIAALVPALVLLLGEGLDALGPVQLALVRGAGFLACLAAGTAGIYLGRRAIRR
jgi:hypothetical protein